MILTSRNIAWKSIDLCVPVHIHASAMFLQDYLFKAPEVKVPLPIEDVKKRGLKFV